VSPTLPGGVEGKGEVALVQFDEPIASGGTGGGLCELLKVVIVEFDDSVVG